MTLKSITKQLNNQTKTIRHLCQINNVHHYISESSQDEINEDDMNISKSDDEMILPTPQNQVKGSILPFTDAELTKLPLGKPRGNNNGSASFNRYKQRPRFFWNFFMKFTVKPLITTKKDQK